MDVIQKIFGKAKDGNVVNIQFVALYKKEQQIKWSFKLRAALFGMFLTWNIPIFCCGKKICRYPLKGIGKFTLKSL